MLFSPSRSCSTRVVGLAAAAGAAGFFALAASPTDGTHASASTIETASAAAIRARFDVLLSNLFTSDSPGEPPVPRPPLETKSGVPVDPAPRHCLLRYFFFSFFPAAAVATMAGFGAYGLAPSAFEISAMVFCALTLL